MAISEALHESRFISLLFLIQGVYYLLTGIWPILDIDSFMVVTGPKDDVWLVKTIGMIIFVTGAGFIVTGLSRSANLPLVVIAVGLIIGFIIVEVYYVLQNVIWAVYLLDAVLQAVLFLFWIISIAGALLKKKKE